MIHDKNNKKSGWLKKFKTLFSLRCEPETANEEELYEELYEEELEDDAEEEKKHFKCIHSDDFIVRVRCDADGNEIKRNIEKPINLRYL